MSTESLGVPRALAAASFFAFAGFVAACSSSEDTPSPGKAGGAVAGAPDSHCESDAGPIKRQTNAAACSAQPAPDAGMDDAGMDDAATSSEYGATIYNQEGDDDDCKYHLKWTSTPIYRNHDVTFTFDVTKRYDDQPATGADPYPDAFLDDTHPAPNTKWKATEPTPGHYTLGPVRFDASGRWTFRFHLYANCVDLTEDSPHGHVAFYIDVP